VRTISKVLLLAAMLLGLPMAGILLDGRPLDPYVEFPPRTRHVLHQPFSWWVFAVLVGIVLVAVILLFLAGQWGPGAPRRRPLRRPFPWWGWAGAGLIVGSWVLAWTRLSWVGPCQGHTFTGLWLGYILTVNAWTLCRSGRSPLTHSTGPYLTLFPLSAVFWWFFEYLNRFVQNWFYVGESLDAWSYFWYATLPFSTVLPAVLATREWVRTFSWPDARFRKGRPVRVSRPRLLSAGILLASGTGLALVGIWPNLLYPLLWVAPLLIIVSLHGLFGEPHLFSPVARGDWSGIVSAATAALLCGFFWEMWNLYSVAKWVYSIPYVHRFQVFEMPVLGYAGYLPFGMECVAVARLFLGTNRVDFLG